MVRLRFTMPFTLNVSMNVRRSALRLGKHFYVNGMRFWERLDIRLCSKTRYVGIEIITALLH